MWSELTWPEFQEQLANARQSAILPVGATEQHGPHLGTGMDWVLADKLCAAVSKRTNVPMLPVLPYGCSIGHSRRWPGTIALQPATLIQVVKEIGDWAHHSGVRRLFMINTHVTNAAPLRCALELLRAEHDDLMVCVLNSATISERVRNAHFADAEDWHANAAETALMMAIAPELVRERMIAGADDQDRTEGRIFSHPVNRTSLNGVTGSPSQASLALGQELFSWMVDDLSSLVESGKDEEPPLAQSYFDTASTGHQRRQK